MAVTADKVVVELELKDGDYTAKVKRAEAEFTKSQRKMVRSAEEAERDIERALGGLPESLKARYRDLGASIGSTLMGVSRAAQITFGAITAYSLKLAADAAEIESAFEVAFGSATVSAKAFSEQLAETAGRDSVVLREQMTRLQLVLTGTGVAAADAAKMVQSLTAIGVDAGSLFNTSDAVALQKIISGITGEAEPLKAFGVVLTEAAVKAELLRLGFKGTAEGATEAQKSIARTNLILKGLNVAQGDAARTADSAANTTKRMTAEFNKAARELGTQLLPAMTKLFGATTDVLKAFNDLPGGVQVAGLAFLGLIAAAGPIAGLLAGLGRVIKLARDTRLALIALGGAKAAAGFGAGAAAGAGAGLLGGTAVVGGGLLLGTGSFAPAPKRDEAAIQRDLKFNRENLARLEAENASAARLTRARGKVTDSLVELSAAQRAGAAAYAAEAESAAVDASVPGGFGLGSLTGSGSGGAARTRARAASSAAKLETDTLAQDLMRLQESLLTDAERAAKMLAEQAAIIARAVGDGTKPGLITAEQGARLNAGIAGQGLEPFAARDPLQPLGNEGAEIGKMIVEGAAAQVESWRGVARDFVDVLASDNIWEAAGRKFRDAAFDQLEDMLTNIFAALSKGGDGSGNWLSTIASAAFGGNRATGGNVRAGMSYNVGERGTEKFVPATNGYIIPNMKNATAKAGMSGTVRIMIGEGEMFSARVTEIAGPLSVQTAMTGVAYSQDQAVNASKRRGQSFI